jgi:hypothetical protein
VETTFTERACAALGQALKLAGRATPHDDAVLHHRDTCGVVAAVLKQPQAVEDQRDRVAVPHVADYAAHAPILLASRDG